MWTNKKYIIQAALFALMVQTSCTDDAIVGINDVGVPTEITDGYSLNLMVTLDKMGGTSTMRDASVAPVADLPEDLVDMENYIDPEKFRVLFFDKNDKFLFESKSRWVKKLTQTDDDHTDWFVSIPVFSYGNDTEYDWDWKAIRDKLVKDDFKIAVLANRPGVEVFPELSDNKSTGGKDVRKWFDNTGPHWGREQTIWYAEQNGKGDLTTAKDVFDLHHSQYDPIYENKNNNLGHYDFIMTYDEHEGEKKPFMSSTSSWVSWGDNNDDTDKDYAMKKRTEKTSNGITTYSFSDKTWRHAIHPSETNPIPMYGIQRFEKLGVDWKEGTTINLAREGDKPISLLRSVVRIELLMPKHKADGSEQQKPNHMALWYPNIYARCEPMDVWTPTNQIWGESLGDHLSDKCEIDAIMNYGPIAISPIAYTYQERLSWLYGAWKEKNWEFKDLKGETITVAEETSSTPYPRIFNPCIQRNNTVWCDRTEVEDPNYYRWVVYTGERNVNDPTDLSDLTGQGNILYWSYSFDDTIKNSESEDDNADFYYVPITDYSNPNNPVYSVYESLKDDKNTATGTVFGPHKLKKWDGGNCETDLTGNYMTKLKESSGKNLPYPLIRNHVYRLILAPTDTKTYAYQWDFTKDLNATTITNLNADDNWNNPGGVETKILDYNKLQNNASSNGTGKATVNWDWEENPTLTRNSTSQFNSDNTINGYTSIKTGKGENVGATPDDRTTVLTLPDSKVIRKMTFYSFVKDLTQDNKVTYAMKNGETHTAGEEVYVQNNSKETVATLTFGFKGGKDFTAAKADNHIPGMGYFTEGNGENGTENGGTVYIISPKYSGSIEVGVVLNADKAFFVMEDGTALGDYNGIKVTEKYQGLYSFSVKGGSTYKVYCTGSKLGFYGFNYTFSTGDTPYYWSNVGGINLSSKESGMYASDASSPDKFVFSDEAYEAYIPTNEISFTSSNSGKQICYIAEVKVENKDNSMPAYWKLKTSPSGIQQANSNTIYELQGLNFNSIDGGTIYIYDKERGEKENKICVTGLTTITLPHPLEVGYTVTIRGKSSTEFGTPTTNDCVITAGSGLTLDTSLPSNANSTFGNNGVCTFTWSVTSDNTTPSFTLSNNSTGIDFYEISVNLPNSNNALRSANADGSPLHFKVKSEDLHSKSISFDNLLKYKNKK